MDLNVMTQNMGQYLEALKAQAAAPALLPPRRPRRRPPDALINRWFTLPVAARTASRASRRHCGPETNARPPRNGTVDGDQSNVTTLQVLSSSQFTGPAG
jgi:hypothetical protein